MAISDAQYEAWLASENKVRCVLMEATYSSGTEYAATHGYASKSTDTPASTSYDDNIKEVPVLSSSISGDSTIGSITLLNEEGDLDSWVNRAWRGWPLKLYLGDPTWPKSDFRLFVSGINNGISIPRQDEISFSIRDKRELLNEVVQPSLMASKEPKPISLGTLFNAKPTLESAASLIYRFHENGNASVTAVRDNGVAVSYTDNSDGTFTLSASPAGSITCDVSGETTGTPAAIVEWLALRATGISSGDIDSTNLAAFSATYGLGLYISTQRDIIECISDVMESVGGAIIFSQLGLLQMVRLETPGTAVLSLTDDDVTERGFTVVGQEEPRSRITLGHKKNWAVQDEGTLAGSVSAANRDLYGREYTTVTADNSGVPTNYPLAPAPELVGTLIVSSANAQTEATRRATLRSTKRTLYKLDGFSAPFQVQIGETIELTHHRYGFSAGKDAVVVGMQQLPTKGRIILELWT